MIRLAQKICASSILLCTSMVLGFNTNTTIAQEIPFPDSLKSSMKKATRFMMDSVSNEGGFVWYYLPDKSRRWGEMEAYPSMIWVQDGGTVGVSQTLLDAYLLTHDEYYYKAAEKATLTLIKGQSKNGGWNYMIDLAGENSLKKWYQTIGKNGWRLEEFQHYYGNDTYDDDVTSDAARLLLRIYLIKKDARFKSALDKAIQLILTSQYPNGAWPQRFPLKYDYQKNGHPDYSSFYTFNDEVIWENVNLLMQCYQTLHDQRLLESIRKGMNFFLLSQSPQGAWAQQYNHQMEVSGARTYEPAAFSSRATFQNALTLLKFYQYTGDHRFLQAVTPAIEWLEKTKLPLQKTEGGRYTHATNIHLQTQEPIYVHRKGSNVKYGYYYTDTIDQHLLGHMSGKTVLNINLIKQEYERIKSIPEKEIFKQAIFADIKIQQIYHPVSSIQIAKAESMSFLPSKESVLRLLHNQSPSGAWYVKNAMISHPYKGDGIAQDPTDKFSSTNVGDSTDTSPYKDTSDQQYISTPAYIRNMKMLLSYLEAFNKAKSTAVKVRRTDWFADQLLSSENKSIEIIGNPALYKESNGSSVYFDGIKDCLIVPNIPIQGATQFSINVLIKPTELKASAPRFLHAEDANQNRVTIEMRTTKEGYWYLDAFLKNGLSNKGLTLIDSTRLHPVNKWYSITLTYNGKEMITYVDGKPEGKGLISFPPMGAGKTSLGMRLNQIYPFKGFISEVQFYPEALSESSLFKMHLMQVFP